jgi:hypothetical protein
MSTQETHHDIKAIIFDAGGVLVRDMRWDLILSSAPEEKRTELNEAIQREWAKMRVDESYEEARFWEG